METDWDIYEEKVIKGSGVNMEGKNKDVFMQYLVILWSWSLPQGSVGTETWGEYRRGQAVAEDNPVSTSSVVFPKQPSSKGF